MTATRPSSWLVSYDISRDADRSRVAKMLEGVGHRRLYSLFEVRRPADEVARLLAAVAGMCSPADDVFALACCAACAQATSGRAAEPDGPVVVAGARRGDVWRLPSRSDSTGARPRPTGPGAGRHRRPILVAYDVFDDLRRDLVRLALRPVGQWVQQSTWVLPSSPYSPSTVLATLSPLLETTDRVVAQAPCRSCSARVITLPGGTNWFRPRHLQLVP